MDIICLNSPLDHEDCPFLSDATGARPHLCYWAFKHEGNHTCSCGWEWVNLDN